MPSGSGGEKGKASFVIDRSHKGEDAPDFIFTDAQGKKLSLADFSGRPLLVNLWATWCAPCVAEMPMLDEVARSYAKDQLAVLTISQDTQEAAKVVSFFRDKGYKTIQPYMDPENQFGFHYATGLLPTSVLYDAQGKEVARVTGALEWTGAEAAALIEETINGG